MSSCWHKGGDKGHKTEFTVTWDTGRRCNYDCSYCPPSRHDKISIHPSLDELKETSQFIFDYKKLLDSYMTDKLVWKVSLTGGEPTINPHFAQFVEFLSTKKSETFKVGLTTNGHTNKNTLELIGEHMHSCTVSYHCENTDSTKKRILDNIVYLSKLMPNWALKINVMFHARHDYFEECKKVCEFLSDKGIKYIPRSIGEGVQSKTKNKLYAYDAHLYTAEQNKWFKNYWDLARGDKAEVGEPDVGHNIREQGRPCCGGRSFTIGHDDGTIEETNYASFTGFQNWYCFINLFWLHIEQQEKLIYHHQTCRANFNKTLSSIGTTDNTDRILKRVEGWLKNGKMPVITCPNSICNCGLCITKAKNRDDATKFLKEILPSVEPVYG